MVPKFRLSGSRISKPSLRATYALLYLLSVINLSMLKILSFTYIFMP